MCGHNEVSEGTIVTVLESRLDEAYKAIEKINKKAKRYGVEQTNVVIIERRVVKRVHIAFDYTQRMIEIPAVDLLVTGDKPCVGNFSFIAKIDHSDAVNIIDIVPGETVDRKFRSVEPVCDHCGVNRFRKETFVVRDEKGNEVQVGRTCLKDYLGEDPTEIIAKFRWLREIRKINDDYMSYGEAILSSLETIAVSIAAIRVHGWCSTASARDKGDFSLATVNSVELVVNPPKSYSEYEQKIKSEIINSFNKDDWETAAKVIEWVRAGGLGDGDYGYNLSTVLSKDHYALKRIGLVVSAYCAYQRVNAKPTLSSAWVGKIKERLSNLDVVIVSQSVIGYGQWGETILIKFRDDDGNLFSWFTSSTTGISNGSRVSLTGTVKDHKEYKGVKETHITRCIVKG